MLPVLISHVRALMASVESFAKQKSTSVIFLPSTVPTEVFARIFSVRLSVFAAMATRVTCAQTRSMSARQSRVRMAPHVPTWLAASNVRVHCSIVEFTVRSYSAAVSSNLAWTMRCHVNLSMTNQIPGCHFDVCAQRDFTVHCAKSMLMSVCHNLAAMEDNVWMVAADTRAIAW